MNQLFGGTYRFHHQGDKNQRAGNNVNSNWQQQNAAKKCISCHPFDGGDILFLNSALTRATRRNIPGDGILGFFN
jgi:predicted CxxxxCH...CXXCH cytochrome family protein